MTQVFHDASKDAGYCPKCQKGYAIGPHVCPTEQVPSKERDFLDEFDVQARSMRALLTEAGRLVNYHRTLLRDLRPHLPKDHPWLIGIDEQIAEQRPFTPDEARSYRSFIEENFGPAHEPPAGDLEKVAKLVPDQWPGGDVFRIGGVLFVTFDDALAAIRRTAQPPGVLTPKFQVRDKAKLGPNGAELDILDVSFCYTIGIAGHVVATGIREAELQLATPTKCEGQS